MSTPNLVKSIDAWKLISRVNCSDDISPVAFKVLVRLLEHKNFKTGQCNPGISLLANRLFPNKNPKTAYWTVQKAIRELREAGIIRTIRHRDRPNDYQVNFRWKEGEINASLYNDDEQGVTCSDKSPSRVETSHVTCSDKSPSRVQTSQGDLSAQVQTIELTNEITTEQNYSSSSNENSPTNDELDDYDEQLERRLALNPQRAIAH